MPLELTQSRRSAPSVILPAVGILLSLGFLAAVGYFVSVYVAAVPFALGFITLTYVRPDLAFGLMLGLVPFTYDIGLGPVKVAISDISMVLALPVSLIQAKNPFGRFLRNPLMMPIGAYFATCIFSILANGDIGGSVTSMIQMGLYLVVAVFLFSSCIDDVRVMRSGFFGLLISCCFLAVVKLGSNSLYVLGLHKNSIGASLSYGLLVAVDLWISRRGQRRWIMLAAILVMFAGLVSTLSRGAWIGALGGVMLILLLRREFVLGARLALLAIPILVVGWISLPEQAKEYASDLSSKSGSINARIVSIDYAYSVFAKSPLLGAGVGLRKQYDATNLVMSTLAETGVAGIFTFLSIFVTFTWICWRARARIQPTSQLLHVLAIGSALVLSQFMHGLVDHYWGRGSLATWAGMGLCANVYACVRGKAWMPTAR